MFRKTVSAIKSLTKTGDADWFDWTFDEDGTLYVAIDGLAFSIGPAIQVRGLAFSIGFRYGNSLSFIVGVQLNE